MELLRESKIVATALELATAAHRGQVDKAGCDYIKHPIAVAESLATEEDQTVALLHDVVEDTDATLDDIRRRGFSDSVVAAVDCLTHRKGEPRDIYLRRIARNALAVRVKLADLAHNSDLGRLPKPTQKDLERTQRYKKEMVFLQSLGKNEEAD